MRLGDVSDPGERRDVQRLRVGSVHRIASAEHPPIELLHRPAHREIWIQPNIHSALSRTVLAGRPSGERCFRQNGTFLRFDKRNPYDNEVECERKDAEQVKSQALTWITPEIARDCEAIGENCG